MIFPVSIQQVLERKLKVPDLTYFPYTCRLLLSTKQLSLVSKRLISPNNTPPRVTGLSLFPKSHQTNWTSFFPEKTLELDKGQ